MPKSAITGSRIRERRIHLAIRQSALARTVGISPTYLNLIEHNKRRIGGKLLIDLSRELGVDPAQLTAGADVALLEDLRDAAVGHSTLPIELEQAEDIGARFPGWGALIAHQHHRIVALEQTAEALTDRLTHDPQLASSMHEMLSVVTAIRSTSAILADSGDVDPEWQARFHRNLYEDSQRLAESSQALVEYLDSAGEAEEGTELTLPQEELEQWLAEQDFHIAALETGAANALADLQTQFDQMPFSPAARSMASDYARQYHRDAIQLPLGPFSAAVAEDGIDPAGLAMRFSCDLATVFRRLASLPTKEGAGRIGLVQCDGSGTLTFRKVVDGFALPRFGATCPLWPLYQALARPMSPVRQMVEQSGRLSRKFLTYAIAQPAVPPGFDLPTIFQATMLILPDDLPGAASDQSPLPVGSSCRICPRPDCHARREPSILTGGF